MSYLADRLPEFELPFVVVLVLTTVLLTGLSVWFVMKKTVIRHKDEELERAREDAGLAVTARNRFLANISHELLNPISTIVGMNEMAMRENAEDVPKPYYASMMNYCLDIRDSSEQLISLINNLLYMSDIESGRLRAEEQEYDTREMLRSVIKKIKSRCDDKGLTFEIKTDETLPAKMYGDMGKLSQILINLLTNAVKYTEVGGIVFSVSVLESEELLCKLRFSVKDTGNGIKSDDIDKIFKAYESLEEKKDARRGIGLGLDISRRFAELMGGTLTCESEYGKGSEFVLTISQKVTDQTPVGDLSADEKSAERVRYVPQFIAPDADVLVVDSSARSVDIIRRLLKETNVFVSSASRIADGLEKIKDTQFNVMLIDRMLLDTDEDEIIGKIRETDPLLPVYIMTSSGDSGETDYASKGYTGYITKPVDGVLLETIIFRHIPEQMRQAPDIAGETNVLPSELEWLYETEGISAADGIRNSGGVTVFIAALEMFRETIDANINILRELYGKGSIKRLTVRLHLLKSSSGMIGAGELSALAGELENAGKKSDRKFIDNNIGRLFGEYESFKDKLAPIQSQKS